MCKMLRFLRKSLPSIRQRHRFLCKTICLSAGMHALLALIVVVGIHFSSSYTFVIRKEHMNKHTRIVLVPLARRVTADVLQEVQKEITSLSAVSHTPKKSVPPKKPASQKASTTVNKQELTKPTTSEAEKKVKKSKKPEAKPVPKKEKEITEKVVKNKSTHQDVAKPVEQHQQQEIQKSLLAQKSSEPVHAEDESILYVGREEMKELRLYKAVCHAVEKEWLPPVGLPTTCVCQIAFVVGPEGVAHEVQILESSKILAYDIAARSAVSRACFESYARGKKCTVVFKV